MSYCDPQVTAGSGVVALFAVGGSKWTDVEGTFGVERGPGNLA